DHYQGRAREHLVDSEGRVRPVNRLPCDATQPSLTTPGFDTLPRRHVLTGSLLEVRAEIGKLSHRQLPNALKGHEQALLQLASDLIAVRTDLGAKDHVQRERGENEALEPEDGLVLRWTRLAQVRDEPIGKLSYGCRDVVGYLC